MFILLCAFPGSFNSATFPVISSYNAFFCPVKSRCTSANKYFPVNTCNNCPPTDIRTSFIICVPKFSIQRNSYGAHDGSQSMDAGHIGLHIVGSVTTIYVSINKSAYLGT